ncbi:MAG TPA: hypothetical protein VNE17_03560 [Nitrolancea sp.]|nr:hypothetical protein [Nitrolancea sp.]
MAHRFSGIEHGVDHRSLGRRVPDFTEGKTERMRDKQRSGWFDNRCDLGNLR